MTRKQIRTAIESLLKLKLLGRGPNGRLIQVDSRIDTSTDIASEGLKRFHEKVLEKARESIRATPVEQREITGSTIAIRADRIPEAKRLIREFRSRLCREIEADKDAHAVYHLEIAFYPLTQSKEKS